MEVDHCPSLENVPSPGAGVIRLRGSAAVASPLYSRIFNVITGDMTMGIVSDYLLMLKPREH